MKDRDDYTGSWVKELRDSNQSACLDLQGSRLKLLTLAHCINHMLGNEMMTDFYDYCLPNLQGLLQFIVGRLKGDMVVELENVLKGALTMSGNIGVMFTDVTIIYIADLTT